MILKIILILFALYLLTWLIDFSGRQKPQWGITFSQFYAQEELSLNWQESYLAVLDEFNNRDLRLIAYWQYLESEEGQFDFSDLDWQIEEAEKRNKQVVLVVGRKVPRWPECHEPDWLNPLTEDLKKQKLLIYLETIIKRYQNNKTIWAWQIENEPLFRFFGNCPKPDKEFLKKEIQLIKSLDPTRPIIVTDSGEISTWLGTAGISEIFGTTLYRQVWNKHFFGWLKYPYPPFWYALRSLLVKSFSATKEVIISELQAEPWAPRQQSIVDLPLTEQVERFKSKDLKNNLRFAQKTGIDKIYLWGAEWWYWRKIKGDESYWETGKEILNK